MFGHLLSMGCGIGCFRDVIQGLVLVWSKGVEWVRSLVGRDRGEG